MKPSIYSDKPAAYYAGAADIMVHALATGPRSRVLELGCGTGATAAAVMAAGKAGSYAGIELNPASADQARNVIDTVLCGDVESLDLGDLGTGFDALLMSEVLEHLTDPWTTVKRLSRLVKPGGVVLASSPNAAHWKITRGLMAGRFDYTPDGVMDRTHLRWFTPATYREMFEGAGVQVMSVTPLCQPGVAARLIGSLSGGRLSHLFVVQIFIQGRMTA